MIEQNVEVAVGVWVIIQALLGGFAVTVLLGFLIWKFHELVRWVRHRGRH